MGDRATLIITDGRSWSPSIYFHWDGSQVKEIVRASLPRIRPGDVSYTCARIVGTAHNLIPGNLSLGVSSNDWSEQSWDFHQEAKKANDRAIILPKWEPSDEDLERVDPGDNGVFILDCRTGELTQYLAKWNSEEQRYKGYRVVEKSQAFKTEDIKEAS